STSRRGEPQDYAPAPRQGRIPLNCQPGVAGGVHTDGGRTALVPLPHAPTPQRSGDHGGCRASPGDHPLPHVCRAGPGVPRRPGWLANAHLDDREGRLVATAGNRVFRLYGDRFEELPAPPSLAAPAQLRCVLDSADDLWGLVDGSYLGRFQDGRWQPLTLPEE